MLRLLDVPKIFDDDILLEHPEQSALFDSVLNSIPGKIPLRVMKHIFSFPATSLVESAEGSTDSDFRIQVSGDFNPVAEQKTSVEKSLKADNAEVPVDLWNKELFDGEIIKVQYVPEVHDRLLESIRTHLGMLWFRRRLFLSFCLHMRLEYGMNWAHKLKEARNSSAKLNVELLKDGETGADPIRRGVNASWWIWDSGSTLFFWRWPKEAMKDARDGSSFPWKFYPPPAYKISQKFPSNEVEKQLMIDKVLVPIERGYISPGLVKSLSGFFSVPKGPTDIRLVYDMTKCGLNKCLWSPRLYLPVPESFFDSIDYNSYMSDIYQGEMCLNYFSDPEPVPYMGVDVTDAVLAGNRKEQNKKI